MLIPPKYFLTPKISKLLQSIEASKEVINSISIPLEVEINIRRKSSLKSSLFSARIEGNTLTLSEVEIGTSKDKKKVEVFNILKALGWIHEHSHKELSQKDILKLHSLVMDGLIDKSNAGFFRTNLEAIFNSAGIAIYLPPRPTQINPLINRLVEFLKSNNEPFIPIRACLAHYTFEKIHPFLDGSGRVGRLLLQLVLQRGGYGMKGLLPLEEYLDNHRLEYYRNLEATEKDVTDYLGFVLEAIAETAKNAKIEILKKKEVKIEDLLLPRRAEILNIIKDHTLINFDAIKRRFMSINERTLRYDLKYLQNRGLIKKRGTTKGVWYETL